MRYNGNSENPYTQWRRSNLYFVGLEVSKKHTILKACSGVRLTINFKSTVPIFPPQSTHQPKLEFKLGLKGKYSTSVVKDRCTYQTTGMTSRYGINITVTSACTDLSGEGKTFVDYELLQTSTDDNLLFWLDYKVEFRVSLIRKGLKHCRSHNDPHIDIFDKPQTRYQIKEVGDYMLYRDLKRAIEIHTSHWPCSGFSHGICNCGVAIKEKEDIIVFSICNEELQYVKDRPNLLHIRLHSCCPLSSDTTIKRNYEGSANKYRVVLPSGTRLTITRQKQHIDIDLYAPADNGKAEGLCGNADGDPANDFFLGRNGKFALGNKAIFADSWRLDEKESFFKIRARGRCIVPNETWCTCKENKGKELYCLNSTNSDSSYELSKAGLKDIHILLVNRSCTTGRKRRYVAHEDVFYNDDVILNNDKASFFVDDINDVKKSLPLRKSRSKRSVPLEAMSKYNATVYCKMVLEDSALGKRCKNVSQSDMESIKSACVSDLQITGDLEFARGAFGVMKDSCERNIFRNISLYKNSSNGELSPPMELVKDLCPNDCSNNGNCTNRICICDAGYTSVDCSAQIGAAPKLMGIYNSGLCDVRERPCKKTDILGTDFLDSDNLTCHVQEHKVLSSDWMPNPYPMKFRGEMFDLYGVRCNLPDPPTNITHYNSEGTPASGLWISISNDGKRKSVRQMRFISYDSVCISCNRSGNCTQTNNTCLINGHCFRPYQWNPKDWCQLCMPKKSTNTWTKRQDNRTPSFEFGQNDQFAIVGEDLPIQLKASDPDNRPVKYSLISSTASDGYTLRSTGLLQWNVTSSADFTVQVTDECNANDTITVTINVVKCPCRNGGQCYPHPYHPRGSGQYACQCSAGFSGARCEKNIDDCVSVSCGNGTCIDGVNNYTCRCDAGFIGSLCVQRVYNCTNETCFTGVDCTETASGITCGPCPEELLGDGKTCLDKTTPTRETTPQKMTEYSTTDRDPGKYSVKLELRVIMDWDNAYKDKESSVFKLLASGLEIEIFKVYKQNDEKIVKIVRVISMRKGSIIVEFELVFNKNQNNPLQMLRESIQDGKLGSYQVDAMSLKLKVGEKTAAPNTARKPNLVLILPLVGLGILIIIIAVLVIFVRKTFRVNCQVKDAPNAIEMEPQSEEPLPKKAPDIDGTGHVNSSYH